MKILGFFLKIILKLIALPVLLVLGLVCLLAKIAFELSSFFIGALILYIIGCSIYCVFQSLWLQLALLVGIGLAIYAALFLFVVFQEIGESIKGNLRDFIFSYSHIIDDDRRLNAERMEAAFYSGRRATPEPVQPAATESSADDKELLLKLLQNPEMAALLKSLAKTL